MRLLPSPRPRSHGMEGLVCRGAPAQLSPRAPVAILPLAVREVPDCPAAVHLPHACHQQGLSSASGPVATGEGALPRVDGGAPCPPVPGGTVWPSLSSSSACPLLSAWLGSAWRWATGAPSLRPVASVVTQRRCHRRGPRCKHPGEAECGPSQEAWLPSWPYPPCGPGTHASPPRPSPKGLPEAAAPSFHPR